MSCCSDMVKFRTDERVQEIFLLTIIRTAMGTKESVLSLIDPVQVGGHRESLSNCFHPVAHYGVFAARNNSANHSSMLLY